MNQRQDEDEWHSLGRTPWSPEFVAAIVNAGVVLMIPVALAIAAWIDIIWLDRSSRVTAASTSLIVVENLVQLVVFLTLFSPLAVVAAWRTWVHAQNYVTGAAAGWQGVIEAGVAGFVIAVMVLRHGIITRPSEAPPYVIAYGGGAFVIGILLGLVLRTTAVATLRRRRPFARS